VKIPTSSIDGEFDSSDNRKTKKRNYQFMFPWELKQMEMEKQEEMKLLEMEKQEEMKLLEMKMEDKNKRLEIIGILISALLIASALYAGLSGYVVSFHKLVVSIDGFTRYITSGKLVPVEAIVAGAKAGGKIVAVGGGVAVVVLILLAKILRRRG
jgi:hypothetical protein